MAEMVLLSLKEFSIWRREQRTSRTWASYVTGITKTTHRIMTVDAEMSVVLAGNYSLQDRQNAQRLKYFFLISVGKLYDVRQSSVV